MWLIAQLGVSGLGNLSRFVHTVISGTLLESRGNFWRLWIFDGLKIKKVCKC